MKKNSTNKRGAKKIIWAIDPFHEAPKEQLRGAKTIQFLFETTPIIVQPVSMLFSGRYDPMEHVFLENWGELATNAEKSLTKLFQNVKLDGLQPPKLERQTSASVSAGVNGLIEVAKEEDADCIVVSSHARKGATRLLLGSFAETLVLQSPIPVLVVNPKANPSSRLKNILYPTDFSETSRMVFDEVVLIARKLNCKILLFHKLEYLYPSMGYPFVVPPVSEESVQELVGKYKTAAEEWVDFAKDHGVMAKVHISSKAGYAVDDITRTAKKLGASGLIAMASQSGRVASILLGSLTRQVLRNAPCPVLVMHPEHPSAVEEAVEGFKKTAIELGQHPLMS